MLTILPHRPFNMPGRARLVQRKAPVRLAAMTSSQSRSFIRIRRLSRRSPALLTSTSTGPSVVSISSKAPATLSAFVTSMRTTIEPGYSTDAAAAPSLSSRYPMATCTPSSARDATVARPIPRLAPVTRATRSLRQFT